MPTSWDSYPSDYRAAEVQAVLSAVQAGECVSIVGLSGAGKSNLAGFLSQRVSAPSMAFALADANRLSPKTADGLYRLAREALGGSAAATGQDGLAALEQAVSARLEIVERLCLIVDRFDVLVGSELEAACGGLRSLRDGHKYALVFALVTRRPLDPNSELAELFFANTLWLGPLSRENALWSAGQYAARRGQSWDAAALARLVDLSGGYPSLLRAACEAFASGAALELDALRGHPVVQRRVQEFWADQPSAEMLRLAGLDGNLMLAAAPAPAGPASAHPELTASEHRLLVYLQSRPGEVCEKDDLIRAVWPEEQVVAGLRDDSLAQLVRRLREKIEPDPSHPQRILTAPGRGYRYLK